MTGYALAATEHPRGALSLELKSVNSRFLDLQFRVAEELRALEPLLRETIVARVARGKLDCRLSFMPSASGAQALDPAALVAGRVAEMRARLAEVRPLVPEANAAYQARLAERMREAIGTADDERIRTELAVFAVKTDVQEELQRLAAHVDEVERILARGGAAGKRLDFLAQELNREANTLASKAATQRIADCALELKLLIEQIREQVQNIE